MLTVHRREERSSILAASVADYWDQSRRPLASLAFVLPLLVLYEGGLLFLGPAAVRNGADVWLRGLLDTVGLTGYFFLPVLTAGLLLGWHYTTRQRWQLSAGVLGGMLVESSLLGFLLLVAAHLQAVLLAQAASADLSAGPVSPDATSATVVGQLVGFVGAGIYEEVLFRLMLLPLIAYVIRLLGAPVAVRIGGALLLSSLLFSASHYVGPWGESLHWFTFLFRFLAGGFFAALFVFRGFGIAAGSHALYDIFVGIL
jgi:hypothetical protein